MSLVAPASTERAYSTVYSAIVVDDTVVVMDELFPNPSARRDAVVGLLTSNHDEVTTEEIESILAPFGGANADVALQLVLAAFQQAGASVDVVLNERQQDVGPAALFTTFTDYGDGTYVVEHYGSRQIRLDQLRIRAEAVATDYPDGHFDDADEESCRKALEYQVARNSGRVYLMDASRHAAADVYTGRGPE